MRSDIADLERSLNGPMDGRSIRERLHTVETNDSAARAATAALEAAKAMRADGWSAFQKTLVTAAAIVAAAAAVYNAAGG